MRAAIADGSGAVTLTTVDDPAPRSTEVIVQVDSCGICGTDLHIIDGDYPAARTPIVPGHEIAGTIVARGQAARHLEEGVFVVVDLVEDLGSEAYVYTHAGSGVELVARCNPRTAPKLADTVRLHRHPDGVVHLFHPETGERIN